MRGKKETITTGGMIAILAAGALALSLSGLYLWKGWSNAPAPRATLPPTITAIVIPDRTQPSAEPEATLIAAATITPLPPRPAPQLPTVTPTATPVPMPFALQIGSPRYTRAFTHLDLGCQWQGAAGQVFDQNGAGTAGLVIRAAGLVDGQPFERTAQTAEESDYGPGGYEIRFTDQPVSRLENLTVQLVDLQGQPKSEPVILTPPSDCQNNLALVNFQSDYSPQVINLPIIRR